MKEWLQTAHWLQGMQWLIFMFTNIVIIPITVGAAFALDGSQIASLLQLSFIVTGIACIIQALFGHQRAIMEGQSGLWWGVILILASTASLHGMSLETLGGSIAIGIILSGIITLLIGLTGLGPLLAKFFSDNVMGVFMFLLGVQLISIFFEGMLGLPFGNEETAEKQIQLGVAFLSIFIVGIVIFLSIRGSYAVKRFSLLIGIVVGWPLYILFFGQENGLFQTETKITFQLFPFGAPHVDVGIIIMLVVTGLLNTANTFGAFKGTDELYKHEATKKMYRYSFTITGLFTVISGLFGLVPYAPYVSSIGFLQQIGVLHRIPFILGGGMFILLGTIPAIGRFFSMLPLSVGSAVLFVAYLQLFRSSLQFFNRMTFHSQNVYRAAIPIFVGVVIMTFPVTYFGTLPLLIQPLASSGLLVGILLALFLEWGIPWKKYI